MQLLTNCLAIIGLLVLISLIGILSVFGLVAYWALREMYAGSFPFDYPRWYYRLRRWFREQETIDFGAILLIAGVLCIVWLGIVITCKP